MLKFGAIPMIVIGLVSAHPACAADGSDGVKRVVVRAEVRAGDAPAGGDVITDGVRASEVLRSRIAGGGEVPWPARLNLALAALDVEPAVMIGIHLDEPDAALCSHLGIEPGTATLVSVVSPGLPAATGGLEVYDVIVAIDDVRPMPPARLRAFLADAVPGEAVAIEVLRKGRKHTVHVTPEAFDRKRLQVDSSRVLIDVDGSPGPGVYGGQRLQIPGGIQDRFYDSFFRASGGVPLVFDDALRSFLWADRSGVAWGGDAATEEKRAKRFEADMQRIEKAIETSVEQVLARVLERLEGMLQRFADTLTESGGD